MSRDLSYVSMCQKYKYTIRSIACEAFCHQVIISFLFSTDRQTDRQHQDWRQGCFARRINHENYSFYNLIFCPPKTVVVLYRLYIIVRQSMRNIPTSLHENKIFCTQLMQCNVVVYCVSLPTYISNMKQNPQRWRHTARTGPMVKFQILSVLTWSWPKINMPLLLQP